MIPRVPLGRTGLSLRPGELKRCGLKLSSEGGAGLATPKPLVRAITASEPTAGGGLKLSVSRERSMHRYLPVPWSRCRHRG